VPPPSPEMLLNHIAGNRKCPWQLKQVCCTPDTGENHNSPSPGTPSDRGEAISCGLLLRLALGLRKR